MTWRLQRERFPVLRTYAYLNAGAIGPVSAVTAAAIDAASNQALIEGGATPNTEEQSRSLRSAVRQRLAKKIGVAPNDIALAHTTTDACRLAVRTVRLTLGDEVVTTDAEHPGLLQTLYEVGARVVVTRAVGLPADDVTERITSAVTPRTRLIAMSHVGWMTGQLLPIVGVREALPRVPLLVDGAQAVGAIPVHAAPYDFYVFPSQKWLCGPEGIGAIYIRSTAASAWSGKPPLGEGALDTGWLSLSILSGLLSSLEETRDGFEQRGLEMARKCRRAVEQIAPVAEQNQETPILSLWHNDPNVAAKALLNRGIVVRSVPGSYLRICCGYWTSDEDIARLASGLRAL